MILRHESRVENSTRISGHHEHGKKNDDVLIVHTQYRNNFPYFPSVICEVFVNLKSIEFTVQSIKELDENSFVDCRNLEKLLLSHNEIQELPDGIFDSLIKLEVLSLSRNKLKTLNSKIFAKFINLRDFRVGGNPIKDFEDNTFAPLVNLRVLSIAETNLTKIKSSWFGNHSMLEVLYFEDNQIDSFDERVLDKMPALKTINGAENPCVTRIHRFTDETEDKSEIRKELKNCFENYKKTLKLQ